MIFFVLQSTYSGAGPCHLWIDLDISMTGQKTLPFEIDYSNNSHIFTQINNLFSKESYSIKNILVYILCTQGYSI